MKNLAESSLTEFLNAAAARTPTPGGGAGCALIAAIGIAFGEMAARYSTPQKGSESDPNAFSRQLAIDAAIRVLERARHEMCELAERDVAAFGAYDAASKLPKNTPEEIEARKRALTAAARGAAGVPLSAIQVVNRAVGEIASVASTLNKRLLSDAGVAALALEAAARGLALNVRANLSSLPPAEAEKLATETRAGCEQTAESCARVLAIVDATLP